MHASSSLPAPLMEKLFEGRTYVGNVALTDRMDYTAAMLNNWAWCLAARNWPAGGERRSNCLRTIAGELSRFSSHYVGIGAFGQDVGVFTTSGIWASTGAKRCSPCWTTSAAPA